MARVTMLSWMWPSWRLTQVHSTLRNDLVFRVGVGIFARRQESSPHALKPRCSIRIGSSSYKLEESACRRGSADLCSESNCAEYSMQVTDKVRLRSTDDRVLGRLPKFLVDTRCLESTARYSVPGRCFVQANPQWWGRWSRSAARA